MPLVGYEQKPVFIVQCVKVHLIPITVVTHHYSAAFVYPEIDDDIDIEINPADLRIDVYRASGAGGQHVTKLKVRCELPICQVALLYNVRTIVHSTRTKIKR